MIINIELWMQDYIKALKESFQNRIWLIGLQGSYARGEATESSDLDTVLILDTVSSEDLKKYSKILDTLTHREKACGFVSGKDELFAWEPSDLFQFCYDTVPYIGSLDQLLKKIRREDVRRAIWTGVCNIYHICAHNFVHEKNLEQLKGLYKSAFFVLQAIAFLQTGQYEKDKTHLIKLLKPEDRVILYNSIDTKAKGKMSQCEWEQHGSLLLSWASAWIKEASRG